MNVQHLVEKWSPVLDHPDLGTIKDTHKRSVVAQLLENQEIDCRSGESAGYRNPQSLLTEAAPTNNFGASSSVAGDGNIDIYDPVLISLVRRSMPNLIAYDICGVQPMSGPTGLIFAMRSRFRQVLKHYLTKQIQVLLSSQELLLQVLLQLTILLTIILSVQE